MKNDLWFEKLYKELGEQVVESKVDKFFVAEGMYLLEKIIPLNFNFLDFPMLVRSLNSSCDLKPSVSFCINFAPFCNILGKT